MEIQKRQHSILEIWNNYWFRPAPLFNLAICRIIFVTFQLIYILKPDYFNNILNRASWPDAVYTPLPFVQLLTLPFGWSEPPPDIFLFAIYWITVGTGLFALLGFKTNLSLIPFSLGCLWMQKYLYSFGKYHHPEALMMMALFVLALSPSGRVLSIDDIGKRIQFNLKKRKFETFNIVEENSSFARWPLLFVQWMFALVYLSAGLAKLTNDGLDWFNGYTLQYYLLTDGLRWGSDLGVWLAHNHTMAVLSSLMAVGFEATFFLVLIFPQLVWIYIPLGASLHIGIYLAQRAPFFQFIALYAVFIPWASIVQKFTTRPWSSASNQKPEILYDGLCPLCIRSMTVLCYFDWFNRLIYSDLEQRWKTIAETHPQISLQACLEEMHLILPNGAVKKGFFAFREILRYIPILWPLQLVLYLPGSSNFGPKIYKFVASRRKRFNQCSFETCSIDSQK
ncbi:DCC1-like thiol-disulfide oxidoreductase family protein [Limnoraphis robusta]|uniref:DCC1-like thiol-disulfide oxidoreductase family protein n=1 Tax=Limnoraphis robusta TaxID=1118279 RepID=UPI00066B6F96|nr:DCC1-like thiol-disulfide oxidoreductase family protein [Limnoraphis robusta]